MLARAGRGMKGVTVLLAPLAMCWLPVCAQAQRVSREELVEARTRRVLIAASSRFAHGDYVRAAELYLEAYRIRKRPYLLKNAALSFERAEDYDAAQRALARYLGESPRARDRPAVEQRIAWLQARTEAAKVPAGGAPSAISTSPGGGDASASLHGRRASRLAPSAGRLRRSQPWPATVLLSVAAAASVGALVTSAVALGRREASDGLLLTAATLSGVSAAAGLVGTVVLSAGVSWKW